MRDLPARPDLDNLKKQAKRLLREARAGDAAALRRFAEHLPALRGTPRTDLADHELKLHDAQSVVARGYGFASWPALARHVAWARADRAERQATWAGWVYDGNASERARAVALLRATPDLVKGNPWLACAIGGEAAVAEALARDPAFVVTPGGPRNMPPLVAVTHSRLMADPAFEPGLLACAALLLSHGADVAATWIHPRFPDSPLSALYGAAGVTHHAVMTKLLLEAGADPNDNESLYHSVESPDDTCTRLLLDAGARVTGTNAIARNLDNDRLGTLRLLLARDGAARERPWIHHALLRGRSLAHVEALIAAGADPRAANDADVSLYRFAQRLGRADVVARLEREGVTETLDDADLFVAACARGDATAARALRERVPDIVARLSSEQLQTLPRLAEIRAYAAVRTMLALGWPREVKTAWDATALNLAVMQGDAAMADLLLANGADWRTKHGYGNDVRGTLSHASQSGEFAAPSPCDYAGCARALLAHGVPASAFADYTFSPEVSSVLGG